MQARLPEAFLKPPALPLEVRATEPYRAAGAPGGYYEPGTPDGSRPGVVYLNLLKLDTRPLYDLEALLYHEAVPGHHLQISSILSDPGIPRLRQVNRWWQDTAFVEGWALYTERLAREMGFYEDPYSDFGRLAGELWRATRLVVDTGLHAKRWSREQAIRYLDENTPSAHAANEQAVDRYLAVPGQATAFTVGMLRILEERERARAALGPRFDLRQFHAVVLENGHVPLWALRENVDRWIAASSAGDARVPAARTAPLSDCDRLASHPEDPQRVGPGVERGDIDLPVAIAACERAAAADPATPRYRYQLAAPAVLREPERARGRRDATRGRHGLSAGAVRVRHLHHPVAVRARRPIPASPSRTGSAPLRAVGRPRGVQYLRYTLKGSFDACAARAGDDELLVMLEAATGAAKDFYEGLIVEDLGEALVARLGAPARKPEAAPARAVASDRRSGVEGVAGRGRDARDPRRPRAAARAAGCARPRRLGEMPRVARRRGHGALRLRRFGETREASARLQALILSGEKTVTATSPWLYDADSSQRPVEGGWSVLLDADGAPAAVLRTTTIRTLPFSAVTAEDSQYEGKPVRPIEAWRDVHRRYFDRMLTPLGRAWSADMPVTLERFEVACRG